MKPVAMEKSAFIELCHDTDEELFELVKKNQGSVSAEHGIGLLKKKALRFSRSSAELAVMKGVKHALDPKGLLNPGKIFD
jgi:FAD/FMN-containing dehydrogenase